MFGNKRPSLIEEREYSYIFKSVTCNIFSSHTRHSLVSLYIVSVVRLFIMMVLAIVRLYIHSLSPLQKSLPTCISFHPTTTNTIPNLCIVIVSRFRISFLKYVTFSHVCSSQSPWCC